MRTAAGNCSGTASGKTMSDGVNKKFLVLCFFFFSDNFHNTSSDNRHNFFTSASALCSMCGLIRISFIVRIVTSRIISGVLVVMLVPVAVKKQNRALIGQNGQ